MKAGFVALLLLLCTAWSMGALSAQGEAGHALQWGKADRWGQQALGKAPFAGVDLDVLYIQRTPLYARYDVIYEGGLPRLRPGTESDRRWPLPGETVTFTARIANKGDTDSPPFVYVWSIDGAPVASGTHPGLASGAEAGLTYAWTWQHQMAGECVLDDHTVGLMVDPDDLVAEAHEDNNALQDRTNALSLLITMTPAMRAAYDVPMRPDRFPYSAEDWLQHQVRAMNDRLLASQYAVAPEGAREQVRIDRIVIADQEPPFDLAHDGRWFVDADYRRGASGGYDPVEDIDWSFIHELGHQVGLIDLYNYNISPGNVLVNDVHRRPVNMGYVWTHPDIMGGGRHSPP
ncbi:MAG: CARDB domain-containing protein [Anaerolineae bacterium]